MSVIKRLSLYEFTFWAEIWCPLSVLEKVRIIEFLVKKIYENFVGTLESVRNIEVSVPRGSTVFELRRHFIVRT